MARDQVTVTVRLPAETAAAIRQLAKLANTKPEVVIRLAVAMQALRTQQDAKAPTA